MNKDLKKRLGDLRQPPAAKAAVDALRRNEKITPEQARQIPEDLVRASRKAELAEREGADKEAQSAMGTMSISMPWLTDGAEYAQQTRDNQAARSKMPRRKVGEEGTETIGQIIEALAQKPEYEDYTADDLWPHLMSELDNRHLHPKEESNRSDPAKSSITFFPPHKGAAGYSITLGRFRNIVSNARAKSH